MNKNKILIIGGAGYIGSHVALEFINQNCEVTVLDNFSSGKEENLFPEAKFIYCDINNRFELNEAMSEGFDAIVHLAAFKAAGISMFEPESYSQNNISGTINILEAASKNGIKNIIFSSTAAIFGAPVSLPIDEEHPLNPINFYGFTKLEIERILTWFDQLKDIKFVSLRYFNAAGYDADGSVKGLERKPENLIPVVMEVAQGQRKSLKIFGNDFDTPDGTGVRDYIHVSDLASAHYLSFEYLKKNRKSEFLNLGTGTGFSVLEIVNGVKKVSGKDVPFDIVARREGDPANIFCQNKKAKQLLDWEPRFSSLENILESTWKAYNK
jgi:UDP-glucose 4-epimerase